MVHFINDPMDFGLKLLCNAMSDRNHVSILEYLTKQPKLKSSCSASQWHHEVENSRAYRYTIGFGERQGDGY